MAKAKADTVRGNVSRLRELVEKLHSHPEGIEFHAVAVDLKEGVDDLYRILNKAKQALKYAEGHLEEWCDNDISSRGDEDMGDSEEFEILDDVRAAITAIEEA